MSRLILGIGNPDRHDDAAGHAVVQRLGPSEMVVAHSGEPSSLIARWSGVDEVVLVDAMESAREPGRVIVVEAGRDPVPLGRCRSTHLLGPLEAVELSRALGNLPPRVTVIGIEGSDFSFGNGLSPEVDAAVDRVVRMLVEGRDPAGSNPSAS